MGQKSQFTMKIEVLEEICQKLKDFFPKLKPKIYQKLKISESLFTCVAEKMAKKELGLRAIRVLGPTVDFSLV